MTQVMNKKEELDDWCFPNRKSMVINGSQHQQLLFQRAFSDASICPNYELPFTPPMAYLKIRPDMLL